MALEKKLDFILVINKIDRLATELRMSEIDASKRLRQLIENANSCLSQTLQGQMVDEDWETVEKTEQSVLFDPVKGNVIFASAIHVKHSKLH
jgi:ribosome assembly protein 1